MKLKEMKLKEIDVREEYTKRLARTKGEILDFIFAYNLFPEKLYIPCKALTAEGYLSFLFDFVRRAYILQNEGELSPEKFSKLSWGENIILKNHDQIFKERGKLIITECSSSSFSQVDEVLFRLYPGKKPHYLAFDVIRMEDKPFYLLVQAGFLLPKKFKMVDNLPVMDKIMLEEEKIILYPLFKEIFFKDFPKSVRFYLN